MKVLDSPKGESSSGDLTGYALRDALRLLFILVRGSQPHPSPTAEWDRIFLGEKRALAIDFWIRYPDYLADQLLNLYQAGGGPCR